MISSTGYHMDEDIMITLLNSYQDETPLTVDELWAFLDMVKLCFISKLSAVSKSIHRSIKVKQKADKAMDIVLEVHDYGDELINLFDKYLHASTSTIDPSFVTHILYRLKEFAIDDELLRKWLQKQFPNQNIDLADIIKLEGQEQAKMQIIMGTMIGSLREESSLDYEKIFEKISQIEKILENDPVGLYSKMDFETRIDYHNEVRNIANSLHIDETLIARRTVELGEKCFKTNKDTKYCHVGYYLKGKGLESLKESFGHRKNNFIAKNFSGRWAFIPAIRSRSPPHRL
jgi:hypothetical protein